MTEMTNGKNDKPTVFEALAIARVDVFEGPERICEFAQLKAQKVPGRPDMCCVIKLMRRLTTCWSHVEHSRARKVEKPASEKSTPGI